MSVKNNQLSVGGALIYKEARDRHSFWLVANAEGVWEIPKVTVRRGESSVRAVIRMAGETAGMNARVLEEVGRYSGVVIVNGKAVTQKIYYYLMLLKSAGEILGFAKNQWWDYKKALKTVSLKREKGAIKTAEEMIRRWEREKKRKN